MDHLHRGTRVRGAYHCTASMRPKCALGPQPSFRGTAGSRRAMASLKAMLNFLRAMTIVNGARAVAEKPARHRRTTCWNWQRIQEGIDDLLNVRFARQDGFAVERRSRIAHGGWPSSLCQESSASLWTKARRVNGVTSTRARAAKSRFDSGERSLCELAIERGSEQPAYEADPSPIASSGQLLRVFSVHEKQGRLSIASPLRQGVHRSPRLALASSGDPSLVARGGHA